MTEELFIELTDTYVRYPELLFNDGKIYQREMDGLSQTRFVDVTEDVAKAIERYIFNAEVKKSIKRKIEMTKAEERGLEAVPPRWRKTKDGKGKVDSALPVRKFYIRAYEQAEKDLALTWEDVQMLDTCVLALVREERNGADWGDGKKFYSEVLKRFNETRK